LLIAACGSNRPTDPDSLPPFVQWTTPAATSAILEYPTDTVTVEFAAADDGGVISSVTIFLQDAPVVTLSSAPYRTTLNLSGLGHNRPGRVYATATDPTGKKGSTQDTLRFMVRPNDTVRYTMLSLSPCPSARAGHTLSLDAANRRAILFGGESYASFEATNDTWILDLATNQWDSLAAPGPPPVRKDHGAGVLNGTLVVFGGYFIQGGVDTTLQDFATLDLGSLVWTTTEFLPPPPIRSMGAAVIGSELFAYGGSTLPIGTANDSVLLRFDFSDSSWSRVTYGGSGPKLRADAVVVADEEGGRLIVYGGAISTTSLPADASLYRFALTSSLWSSLPQLPQIVTPVTRGAAILDSVNNRALLWGGVDNDGALPTDVWELSLGNLRWRRLATLGAPPAGRTDFDMVFDAVEPRIVVFGGKVGGLGVAETWEARW